MTSDKCLICGWRIGDPGIMICEDCASKRKANDCYVDGAVNECQTS